MFTGKNKEQFEKWYFGYAVAVECMLSVGDFYELSKLMQQGVYLVYFDSLCIRVIPDYDINKNLWFAWVITNDHINRVKLMSKGNGRNVLYFGNRQEALTEAFKKADELINNK